MCTLLIITITDSEVVFLSHEVGVRFVYISEVILRLRINFVYILSLDMMII